MDTTRAASDAERADRKADALYAEAQSYIYQIPEVSKSCPLVGKQCVTIDNQPFIDGLTRVYNTEIRTIRRAYTRYNTRKGVSTKKRNPDLVRANKIHADAVAQVGNIQRFQISCTE